jgi:ketosteroid isomerase-like protein
MIPIEICWRSIRPRPVRRFVASPFPAEPASPALESEGNISSKMPNRPRIYALPSLAALAIGLLAWSVPALAATGADGAATIRAELAAWTQAFNARQADKVCGIFSEDLRYKFGEVQDRGYNDVCTALRRSLGDQTHRSHYTLDLREILVYGDIAVVRLIWTLDSSKAGSSLTTRSLEPGMDIFKRQNDGSWKIIRYLAYTSPV